MEKIARKTEHAAGIQGAERFSAVLSGLDVVQWIWNVVLSYLVPEEKLTAVCVLKI